MSNPIPGDIDDFLNGLATLNIVNGGPTTLYPHGFVVATNVPWRDLTEAQKKSLNKQGWFKYELTKKAAWGSEG